MDCAKVGRLIRALRAGQGLTQLQLAQRLGVSDRAVSKWENGRGAPDVTLLRALAEALDVNIEALLGGELPGEAPEGGNMKKTKYFCCPVCGSLALATGSAAMTCCGRTLSLMSPQKPDADHTLNIEDVEDERYLTAAHPMTREHALTFVAFAMLDRVQLIRLYPEWDLQVRIPRRHGLLLWHCNQHGLFSRSI